MKYPNSLRHQREQVIHKTVQEVAFQIGVTTQTIYRWERGTHCAKTPAVQEKKFSVYRLSPKEAYPTCWQEIYGVLQRRMDEL